MNHNQIMLLDGHPPLNSIRVGPIPVVRLARAKNASVQSRIKQMTSQHKRTTKLCQSRASQTEWAEQHRVLWGQLFIWPLWVTAPGFELGALTQTVALLVPSRLLMLRSCVMIHITTKWTHTFNQDRVLVQFSLQKMSGQGVRTHPPMVLSAISREINQLAFF